MNSDEETKGILVVMILDVIGRPPEHLIASLEKIIEEMDKEKGVSIKRKEIKEPTLMKDQKEFYTTFAEIEIEVEEIISLAILLFKYMPAHVEIISPELIALTNNGWNDVLNELTRRLHGYDEVAKVMQMEKTMLLKKIQEITGKSPEEVLAMFQKKEATKVEKPVKKVKKKAVKKKIKKK